MLLDEIQWDRAYVPIVLKRWPFSYDFDYAEIIGGTNIVFEKVEWVNPTTYRWEKVPGGRQGVSTINTVIGWKCLQCKTTFYGTYVSDLRHGCTGDMREWDYGV